MGVCLMILLDENLEIVHDEAEPPSDAIRESLIRSNAVCSYARKDILYRFCSNGSLSLYSLSDAKIRTVTLSAYDLAFFRKERRVATGTAIVRDIGCEQSRVYMEDCSFCIPTELLFR